MYAEAKIRGKKTELTNTFVTFEFGIKIIISQNGKTPKLAHK